MKGSTLSLVLGLLLVPPVLSDLPYNSASLFTANIKGDDLVFAFLPSSPSSTSFQLQRLNISGKLDSGISPWATLGSGLPFLSSQTPSFVSGADSNGDLWAYSGNCSAGSGGSSLWTYKPDPAGGTNGQWTKRGYNLGQSGPQAPLNGANYLSTGITFSTVVNDTVDRQKFYVFGGMCPSSGNGGNAWTNLANYSNSMLSFTPQGTAGALGYELNTVKSKGPPVAEAGFSITPLNPSVLTKSTGRQTQQQNFVLLGGHTQTAFINTSQIALFSLPEEGWTFTQVSSSGSRTDLTVRGETVEIEPRSGHTAVLSADGKSIIVFGGWVGDISTPAQPQLAVLNLGEGYGGNGGWSWTAPKQTGLGLANGQGIYGHAAVLLPGGVMMVTGGYIISDPSSSRRRDMAASVNRRTLFWNTTSNSWAPSYINPSSAAVAPQQGASNGLSPTARKAAIGAGVGFGLAAVLGAILICLWYAKRMRKKRESRERDLRSLAVGASHYRYNQDRDELGPPGYDRRSQSYDQQGDWRSIGHSDSRSMYPGPGITTAEPIGGWREKGGHEAERTGLLVDVPSPTRGMRRSLHARPRSSVMMGPGVDRGYGAYDGRDPQTGRRGSRGAIHPIAEHDEYDHPAPSSGAPEMTITRPLSDPFKDPPPPEPLRSHPLPALASSSAGPSSPPREGDRDRNAAILSWVDSWAAAREPPSRQDSASPVKDDRTSSSLSDKSHRSHHTTSSVSGPSGGILSATGTISRTLSQRSAAFFSGVLTNPFTSSTAPTTASPGPGELMTTTKLAGRTRRLSNTHRHSRHDSGGRPESGGSSSFTTAETSFSVLQAEGANLLPQPPESEKDPYPEPGSPSKGKHRATTGGWIGSVRRALQGGTAPTTSRSPSPQSTSSSPLKAFAVPVPGHNWAGSSREAANLKPRRAVSFTTPASRLQRSPSSSGPGPDLAWRQRKGARDWAQSHRDSGGSGLTSGGGGGGGGGMARTQSGRTAASSEEGDWDIEAAAEQRVVQVLFTVPRERLRVVNAGTEVEETDRESERAEVVQEESVGAGTDKEVEDKLPMMARRKSRGERMLMD